jgi:hypothetical protein
MRKRASHAVQGGGVSKKGSGGTGKTKSQKGDTASLSSCPSNTETTSTPPSEEDAAKSPEKLPSPMLSFLETVILSGPQLTEFHVSDEEYLKDILQLVRHDCPTLVGNSVDLLKRLKTVERK